MKTRRIQIIRYFVVAHSTLLLAALPRELRVATPMMSGYV